LDYTISIYAAMEIGGIYVPMDGMQPAIRAKKILTRAEPSVLITDSLRFAQLSEMDFASLKLVVITDDDEVGKRMQTAFVIENMGGLMKQADEVAPFEAKRQDIAAILFTSGSTGVPKGVQISYANLHCFIDWAVHEFKLSETDVFSNHAGFHFDLSTFDLFAAAAVGGSVWIVREDEQRDVGSLLTGMKDYRISVWYSVPSVLTLLVNSEGLNKSVTSTLRHVLFAGEVFPIGKLHAVMACLPETCELYNLYGPTETNVCVYYKVQQSDLHRKKPVYIGKPLPGLIAEIIGQDGERISDRNQIGELVISGVCVTPGYWKIQNPENSYNHLHGRHATGDIVGYENGYLYFHGRKDRMLKINGNRVELGEIEAALSSMPEINEFAVVVHTTESGQSLVGYYSLYDSNKKLGLLKIKRFCSERLPRYMIPKSAWELDELPKNQNGKIDYLALKMMGGLPGAASDDACSGPYGSALLAEKREK
jgi:amino acid adenylation domain-containing protein